MPDRFFVLNINFFFLSKEPNRIHCVFMFSKDTISMYQ